MNKENCALKLVDEIILDLVSLEDDPLSAVCDCLFNTFAATHHIGGRSSICNLKMRHAVMTGTDLSHGH